MNDDQERLPVDVRDLHALRLHQLRSAARAGTGWGARPQNVNPAEAGTPEVPEDVTTPEAPPQPPSTVPEPEAPPTPERPTAGVDCEPQWEDAPDEAAVPHTPTAPLEPKTEPQAAPPAQPLAEPQAASAPAPSADPAGGALEYPDFEQQAPVSGIDGLRGEMEALLRGTLRRSVERGAARAASEDEPGSP
jgi:outer membrane biosynthesis protein TonB